MRRGQKQHQRRNIGRLDYSPDRKHGRERRFSFGLADALLPRPGGNAVRVTIRLAERRLNNVDQNLIGCDFITEMFGKVCYRRRCGIAARAQRIVERALPINLSINTSSLAVSSEPATLVEALFTRTSSRPKA